MISDCLGLGPYEMPLAQRAGDLSSQRVRGPCFGDLGLNPYGM